MIEQEKYVKVIVNPLEPAREPTSGVMINNLDITITENGVYEAESPYTGYGKVTVQVPDTPVVIEPLSVTPSTSQQVITASGGVNGYSPITVSAVTSSIDSNIKSSNIKSGVSILGVSGSVVELVGQVRNNEYLTYSGGNVFIPNGNANGITSITVRPTNQAVTFDPATYQQTKTVPSGYSGHGTITVNAVTSSIDSNITAENIKSGVTILGVTGTYSPALPYPYRKMNISNNTLQLYDFNNISLDAGSLSFTDVGTYACANNCYYLTKTGNISWDNLTNVNGERAFHQAFASSNITGKVTFNNLTSVGGSYAFYNAFSNARITGGVEFNGMVTQSVYSSYAFYYAFGWATTNVYFNNFESVDGSTYMFYYAFYQMSGTVYLPKLKSVLTNYAFAYAFSGDAYSSSGRTAPVVNGLFNSLEVANGSYCFRYAFYYSPTISGAYSFTKLNSMTGQQTFAYAFGYCPNLTSLSFPALTSTSFGSSYTSQFNSMLIGNTGVTVHFPSNLQSVIGSWTSVTSGFGGTNTTVLFDLPATT